MYKQGVPEMPSLVQAAMFATILDEIGEYKDAELFDEYIAKSAEYSGNIVKMAGVWGNIWSRVKGSLKKLFISEYKELYNSAKASQDKLTERMDLLKEKYKEAKGQFKNYKFGDWRRSISEMDAICSKNITAGFDERYAKFIDYVTKDFKESNSTPDEESEFDKTSKPEIAKKTNKWEEATGEAVNQMGKGWSGSGYVLRKDVLGNNNTFKVKVDKFENWVGKQVKKVGDKVFEFDQNWAKANKGKVNQELRGAMQKGQWAIVSEKPDKQGYITLQNVSSLSKGKEVEETVEAPEKSVKAPKEAPVESKVKSVIQPEEEVPEEETVETDKDIEEAPDTDEDFVYEYLSKEKDVPKSSYELAHEDEEEPDSFPPPEGPEKPFGEKVKSKMVGEAGPKEEAAVEPGDVDEAAKAAAEPSAVPVSTKGPEAKNAPIGGIGVVQEDVAGLTESQRLSMEEEGPVTGKPDGTTWITYRDPKYKGFAAPLSNVKSFRHVVIKDPEIIAKLDADWAKMMNTAKAKGQKPMKRIPIADVKSILERRDRIIALAQMKDLSPRMYKILNLVNN